MLAKYLKNYTIELVLLVFCFMWAFYYVLNELNPLLYYFTQQPAFLYDYNFLLSHLSYPGGIGQYISVFFEQYFLFPVAGAFILIGITALTSFFSVLLTKQIVGKGGSFLLVALLPLLISVLLWQNTKFPFAVNMQLMLTMAAALWCILLLNGNALKQVLTLFVAGVLVYYMFGAPYLYLLSSIVIINQFYKNKTKRVYLSLFPLLLSLVIPFVFYHFITPISVFEAWGRFSPNVTLFLYYKHNCLLYAWFAFIPAWLLIKLAGVQWVKTLNRIPIWLNTFLVILLFSVLLGKGIKIFNNKQERLNTEIAYRAYKQEWNSVIQLSRKVNSYNRMVNFYVNQAMYYTGIMETNFFSVKQLLGVDGLFVETPLVGDVCMPSSYLYYRMGFVHNALRFAYESQTLVPNSPYVLMQIIDCLIVEEKFYDAQIFLNKLYQNRLYRGFVASRKAFINGQNVGLNRTEVAWLRKMNPQKDFYTAHPFVNAYMLAQANPENKMALDYMYLYYILNNKLGDFVRHLVTEQAPEEIKLTKTFQEALILYLTLSRENRIEGSAKIHLDDEVKNRFRDFNKILKQGRNEAYNTLAANYANTYWFYSLYDSPAVTNNKVNTRKADVNY